jgi:hypothetical protein
MRGNWQHGAPQEGLDTKPTPLQVSGRFVAEFAANICAAKLGDFAALIFVSGPKTPKTRLLGSGFTYVYDCRMVCFTSRGRHVLRPVDGTF